MKGKEVGVIGEGGIEEGGEVTLEMRGEGMGLGVSAQSRWRGGWAVDGATLGMGIPTVGTMALPTKATRGRIGHPMERREERRRADDPTQSRRGQCEMVKRLQLLPSNRGVGAERRWQRESGAMLSVAAQRSGVAAVRKVTRRW